MSENDCQAEFESAYRIMSAYPTPSNLEILRKVITNKKCPIKTTDFEFAQINKWFMPTSSSSNPHYNIPNMGFDPLLPRSSLGVGGGGRKVSKKSRKSKSRKSRKSRKSKKTKSRRH